jgi:hypothetical protein
MAEALTELSWPSLSVFSDTAFPLPTHLNSSLSAYDVLAIANKSVLLQETDTGKLIISKEQCNPRAPGWLWQ